MKIELNVFKLFIKLLFDNYHKFPHLAHPTEFTEQNDIVFDRPKIHFLVDQQLQRSPALRIPAAGRLTRLEQTA